MRNARCLCLFLAIAWPLAASSQQTVVVRPQEIDDVLVNPGIGFMTFQRFNGDKLNEGTKWTEGYPLEYQPFDGNLENENHPMTSLAYFRIYWKFLEPAKGEYRWELIDKALETGGVAGPNPPAPHRPLRNEGRQQRAGLVPDHGGPGKRPAAKEMADQSRGSSLCAAFRPHDPALGARYDGHPDLESVDLSIVGAWGEGAGSADLTQKTREALVDCYLEAFRKTHLVMLLTDEKTNQYGLSKRDVGWRVDCLGDVGGFNRSWCHMYDYYPQGIINFGMRDAWEKAPVTLEVCWVMQHWKDEGWDVDYIIDQSLKWHISSFNAKSSPVPAEWKPHVDRWLKRMGYRFVLRKLTYPAQVKPNGELAFTSWWENKGVAPCYRPFRLALRLRGKQTSAVLSTGADLRSWLPGDNLYDNAVIIPKNAAAGQYELDLAVLGERTDGPAVKLAIAGRRPDGWYTLGPIRVQP